MKLIPVILVALLVALAIAADATDSPTADPVAAAQAKVWEPIPTGYFGDSVSHARMTYKHRKPPYNVYTPTQIVHIAENILAWQNADGGWPKNVEVKDPDAPPIWARFYDLKTEKPIFSRARKITDKYTDLTRERRTGYSWYGYYPAKLLEKEYPAWRNKHGIE